MQGVGVADARGWRLIIETIAAMADEHGWVAEEPELHLLPHLEAAAGAAGLAIRSARTVPDGTFEVDLEWLGEDQPSRQMIRSSLFSLVAAISETVTLIHEPPAARGHAVEVLTGSGGGGGTFASHGHTLRLTLVLPAASSAE